MGSLKKRTLKNGAKWYCRFVDEFGNQQCVVGSSDKAIARQKLARLEREVEQRKVGMLDDFMVHASKPIALYLGEYRQHLESKDNTSEHVDDVINCCESIIAVCGVKRITDLSATAVASHLKKLRTGGLSVRRSNAKSQYIKSFSKWLYETRKTVSHQLVGLKALNPDVDKRHERRALSETNFALLLATTNSSKRVDAGRTWTFTGYDRYVLYLFASMTGFRASECAAMRVCDLGLLDAKFAKNKQDAKLHLHPFLKEELSRYIAHKQLSATDHLWSGKWAEHKRASKLIQGDLHEAEIPYQDESDRFFDFHALRVQFGTNLARADVSLKKAQELMRHSTPILTAKIYSKLESTDLQQEVDKLPVPRLNFEPQNSKQTA